MYEDFGNRSKSRQFCRRTTTQGDATTIRGGKNIFSKPLLFSLIIIIYFYFYFLRLNNFFYCFNSFIIVILFICFIYLLFLFLTFCLFSCLLTFSAKSPFLPATPWLPLFPAARHMNSNSKLSYDSP